MKSNSVKCDICDDTGFVDTMKFNKESNMWEVEDTFPCDCQSKNSNKQND